jgi:hypothetical protein
MRGTTWFDSMKENEGRSNVGINEVEPANDVTTDEQASTRTGIFRMSGV